MTGPGHEPPRAAARVVHERREDGADVGPRVVVEDHRHEDDRPDAHEVPPDRHLVQDVHEPDAEGVQQGVDDEHHAEDGDRVRGRRREPDRLVEEGVREERQAEVDAGRDGDLADEVEPAHEPAPLGGAPAALGASLAAQ